MKKIHPELVKAKIMREYYKDKDIGRVKRDEYMQHKAAYESSEAGLIYNRFRACVQKESQTEDEAFEMIHRSIITLREEVFDIIAEIAEIKKEEMEMLDVQTLQFIIKQAGLALEKIQMFSESAETKRRLGKRWLYSEYERLFNDLIDNVDSGFAMFAPKKSLARKSMKFNGISEEVEMAIYKRAKDFGLTEDDNYIKTYARFFKRAMDEDLSAGL